MAREDRCPECLSCDRHEYHVQHGPTERASWWLDIKHIWSVFFVIAGLASLGLPGLSGFVAELHIFIGAFQAYPVIGGLAVLTAAITATYLLRMFSTMFFGEFNEKWNALNDMNSLEKAGAIILASSIADSFNERYACTSPSTSLIL
mgnify:CR=1 FL=1